MINSPRPPSDPDDLGPLDFGLFDALRSDRSVEALLSGRALATDATSADVVLDELLGVMRREATVEVPAPNAALADLFATGITWTAGVAVAGTPGGASRSCAGRRRCSCWCRPYWRRERVAQWCRERRCSVR